MANVIGIDLGTTNSVVAFLENGKPSVMQNNEGGKTTPSVVLYQEDRPIVGEMAKRQRVLAPDRAIYSIKRFVGCRWNESEERRQDIHYPLVSGPEGLVAVEIADQVLLPEQVQAEILLKMKQTAEDYLGQEVTQAVITCPAYFNDSQRQATKKAAELAGLEALRIVNEPTAAALAYGIEKDKRQRVAVFDFGGGTFDISILEIDDDVFEVKSTCGDTFLGGDTIDKILIDWISEQIVQQLGFEPGGDNRLSGRIAEAAEKVKCELSSLEQTNISLPFIGADESGPKHFSMDLDRAQFEQLIAPVLERLRKPCEKALKDAKLEPRDLKNVVLVGGSTRIPAVQRLVEEIFGQPPNTSVSPDEAVALGAAIQGGILSGELDEVLLLDVTPLSLGIELEGGVFSVLIPRNSSIPTTTQKRFTTVRDNQRSVRVHALQGERRKAAANRTLARFRLENIAPAPREVPEIEVSFTIDANGILQVSAMDLTTGSRQEVVVESYQPTSEAEIERTVTEAETKSDEDRAFMQKLAVRRRAENMRREIESFRNTHPAERLTESQDRRIKEAFFHLDLALAGSDWAEIEAAERQLKAAYSEIMLTSSDSFGGDEIVFQNDEEAGEDPPTGESRTGDRSSMAKPDGASESSIAADE